MNPFLAVKQYSRSSADQEVPLPHELRPVKVLQMTMSYLMHKIMNLCDTPDVSYLAVHYYIISSMKSIKHFRCSIFDTNHCTPYLIYLLYNPFR